MGLQPERLITAPPWLGGRGMIPAEPGAAWTVAAVLDQSTAAWTVAAVLDQSRLRVHGPGCDLPGASLA
jgi:hypothetical protein